MSRPALRSDLADAADRAGYLLGCTRALRRLEDLTDGLEVLDVAAVRHEGHRGVLAVAEDRLLFVCRGWFTRAEDEVLISKVALLQWRTFLGAGTITVHTTGGTKLEFTAAAPQAGLQLVARARALLEDGARELADVRAGVLDMAEAWRKALDVPDAPSPAQPQSAAGAWEFPSSAGLDRQDELAGV